MSGPRPLVEAAGIFKSFGTYAALRDVSIEVRGGEVVALIGPSGSGKSTLLRCLNLLDVPDRGTVRIGDHLFRGGEKVSRARLNSLRSGVGMVFQSFNLFPHMSVLRNVCIAQERVLGRSRKEAEARAALLLERVGLAEKMHEYPNRCSGGQQQRVAIARALALDPKVMLFDEPTSALDPELGLEVLTVMRELAESGMTMIVVTHEMAFAEQVSNRVMVMADGRIVEQGPSAEVMRNPQHERTVRFLNAVTHR